VAGSAAPILTLTAHYTVEDKVRGIDTGADDYLPKLLILKNNSRVRALLRRKNALYQQIINVADLSVNTRLRWVRARDWK
jgi:DNA-binding response OmpR family regulator